MSETIQNYRSMADQIKDMTEDELKSAINYEVSAYGRVGIIERMHMKYCKLRAALERAELTSRSPLL